MSEYSDKLRYLGLWGAGAMIGAPFDEQELMAWAHKQIQSMQVDIDALTAEVTRLKSAIASDLDDAKLNCGRFNTAKDCSAWTDRSRICSDCPVDWLHHSEAAVSKGQSDE